MGRRLLRALVWTGGVVALGVAALFGAAVWRVSALDAVRVPVHRADVPFPAPPTEEERAALGGEAASAEAVLARSVARGAHLVRARLGCVECHGQDFGGGVMIEDAALGALRGPNLTLGRGSVTRDYTMADWDRLVRHGVKRDGRRTLMPAEDYFDLSDRELADVVAYVRSLPPVDRDVGKTVALGPLGLALVATGALAYSADKHPDHRRPHAALPPREAVTAEFGAHVAGVCRGCHRAGYEGGPIVGGAPGWPPAANLTPHATGLGPWTFEQFERALREGVGRDGAPSELPMRAFAPYGKNMTDTEIAALWAYLRSLPPRPTGR